MKWNLPAALLLLAFSCREPAQKPGTVTGGQDNENAVAARDPGFFPVTDFLQGQMAEISTKGINPMKIVEEKGKVDSNWIKIEALPEEFAPFLTPVIDSANLKDLFTQKAFLDQTINAFTLTYDPTGKLPDSLSLQRWDVYIDPHKNSVTRIYLLKKLPGSKLMQLTWQANKWCKTVILATNANGNTQIEKETTIKWDF